MLSKDITEESEEEEDNDLFNGIFGGDGTFFGKIFQDPNLGRNVSILGAPGINEGGLGKSGGLFCGVFLLESDIAGPFF